MRLSPNWLSSHNVLGMACTADSHQKGQNLALVINGIISLQVLMSRNQDLHIKVPSTLKDKKSGEHTYSKLMLHSQCEATSKYNEIFKQITHVAIAELGQDI